jgi:hypothetical protein
MVVIEKNRLNVKNEKIRYNKMTIPSVIVQKRYRNNFWKLKFVKVGFFFFFLLNHYSSNPNGIQSGVKHQKSKSNQI